MCEVRFSQVQLLIFLDGVAVVVVVVIIIIFSIFIIITHDKCKENQNILFNIDSKCVFVSVIERI